MAVIDGVTRPRRLPTAHMQWVDPAEVRAEYGDAVNPRRETTRGLTVNEFVEIAERHVGKLRVGWFPGKLQMLEDGAEEVPRDEAVNMRLNAVRVRATDLDDVHEFLSDLPPGVVTEPDGDELVLLYRID